MKEGLPQESGKELILTRRTMILAFALGAYYLYTHPKKLDLEHLAEEDKERIPKRLRELQEKHNKYYKEKDPEKKSKIMTVEEIIEMRELYVSTYDSLAREVESKYGIPRALVLAQAMEESGSGSSDLALEANNHFAIKHHQHCSPEYKNNTTLTCCVLHGDDNDYDRFRKYKNVEESYEAYGELLKTNPAYGEAFNKCKHGDLKCWTREIGKVYATDPKYIEKLRRVITDNKLGKLEVHK